MKRKHIILLAVLSTLLVTGAAAYRLAMPGTTFLLRFLDAAGEKDSFSDIDRSNLVSSLINHVELESNEKTSVWDDWDIIRFWTELLRA